MEAYSLRTQTYFGQGLSLGEGGLRQRGTLKDNQGFLRLFSSWS